MKKHLKTTLTILIAIFITTATANAIGTLTPTGTSGDQTHYSLNDIYTKLTTGVSTSTKSGTIAVPEGTPTASFRTLTEVYNAIPEWRTLSDSTTTVQEGYYEATDLTTIDSDLTAGNISDGIDIFGVIGEYVSKGYPSTNHDTAVYAGDDGTYQAGATQVFTDNGDGTLKDSVTGLIWQKDGGASGNLNNWQAAIDYCEGLSLGDSSDWRLPNIKEIISIIDFGNPAGGAYSFTDFSNMSTIFRYWSSTVQATTGYVYAWRGPEIKVWVQGQSSFLALCVR
jgi:hypothetical protein